MCCLLKPFNSVCGGLSRSLFLIDGCQLPAKSAFFPFSLFLGQWDEIFHLSITSVMFFTPVLRHGDKDRGESVTEGSESEMRMYFYEVMLHLPILKLSIWKCAS